MSSGLRAIMKPMRSTKSVGLEPTLIDQHGLNTSQFHARLKKSLRFAGTIEFFAVGSLLRLGLKIDRHFCE